MSKATLPTPESNAGKAEWAEVYANDAALREAVNSISNEQITEGAGITDGKLASPNNSAYRVLHSAEEFARTDLAAGTYILGSTGATSGKPVASGSDILGEGRVAPSPFGFDDADYTVGGKTQKLRLRAQILTNATKPTIKFTFGLYPVTVAGGADALVLTLGTVVSGSTVEINEPAASTPTSSAGSDFTIPSDGVYLLGVVTSGTLTNNAAALLGVQLQSRNV